ncbi:MAG: phospholipid-binding protein MlaC [Paracoccaceae bacterium]
MERKSKLTTRRVFMAASAAASALFSAGSALALTENEAKSLVETTLGELFGILKGTVEPAKLAPKLRGIMEARGNMPLIAKFSAGRVWGDMNSDQQTRYSAAFAKFVSVTYARRFREITGEPKVNIGKIIDAGRKGVLVETPFDGPQGEKIAVEWLVSDRAGRVEIIDLIVEGISMATTQREEISAMYEKRGNDVEALISDLNSGT